jgi:hypothetical protein
MHVENKNIASIESLDKLFFQPLHIFRADLSWIKFGILHNFNNSIGRSSRKGIRIPQPDDPRLYHHNIV